MYTDSPESLMKFGRGALIWMFADLPKSSKKSVPEDYGLDVLTTALCHVLSAIEGFWMVCGSFGEFCAGETVQ